MTSHSPPSRGPRPSAGDKRERILDAAQRVFARRGFYNARVAEIARDAGVADGTIYLYFKNKDDLLISLFESRMERINGELKEAIAGCRSARDQVGAFVKRYFALVRDNPDLAEVLTVELRQSSKFMKESANPRFGELLKVIAGIVGEGQERGEFETDVPSPLAARMIFGILDELAIAWLLGRREKFDIERVGDWAGAVILRGLERRSNR